MIPAYTMKWMIQDLSNAIASIHDNPRYSELKVREVLNVLLDAAVTDVIVEVRGRQE